MYLMLSQDLSPSPEAGLAYFPFHNQGLVAQIPQTDMCGIPNKLGNAISSCVMSSMTIVIFIVVKYACDNLMVLAF